ncbi:MAG: glycosyltransferase [Pirellulales bacterium]
MISVIVPVLNECPTVAAVVAFAQRAKGVTEVIVVDDGSIDGTPELAQSVGARVVTSTLLGKGASMEDGTWAAQNDIVVFLDGDLSGLAEDLIEKITAPLVDDRADFVKASFTRTAGRVTVLTARPLLMTFFPEMSHIEQPLGGIIATRRSVLRGTRFENDYGVDVGLLLDVASKGARIEQVDIGHIEHDSQSLDVLGDMAKQVVRVILDRASKRNRLNLEHVREVEEVERRSQAEILTVLQRMGQPERLALFDMDGTLLRGRFVVVLAERCNRSNELAEYMDNSDMEPGARTQKISALFSGVSKSEFEDAAMSIPLMPGAVDTVRALRKLGYQVGIVSDSFRVATEIIRRRVFADFSIAHLMKFRRGIATGSVTLSPAMLHSNGCNQHHYCKMNVLMNVCDQLDLSPEHVLAIGDGEPDICMLKTAGVSVAFQPKSEAVVSAARHVVQHSLSEILGCIQQTSLPTSSRAVNPSGGSSGF